MKCLIISLIVSSVVSIGILSKYLKIIEKENQEFLSEIKKITLDVVKNYFKDKHL